MTAPKHEPRDVIIPLEQDASGDGFRGIRVRDGQIGGCWARPAKEGRPLGPGHALVRAKPIPDRAAYEIAEVYYEAPAAPAAAGKHAGPPRVASDEFRTGYDAIDWGKPAHDDLN